MSCAVNVICKVAFYLSHTSTLPLSLSASLSLSLSHTNTHTHTHSLSLHCYHSQPKRSPGSAVSCAVNVICELARKNPQNYLALAPLFFKLLT